MGHIALTESDRAHLRRCVELAEEALASGDEPFAQYAPTVPSRELEADGLERASSHGGGLGPWTAEASDRGRRPRSGVNGDGRGCAISWL
jgi:hypothetical protein